MPAPDPTSPEPESSQGARAAGGSRARDAKRTDDSDATRLIEAAAEGDRIAAEALLPLVHDQLRALADARLARERPDHTLQATALVNEAWIRLVEGAGESTAWKGRAHFFGAAAEAMRRILIDSARARGALKRGGAARRLVLDPDSLSVATVPPEVADLDDALRRFEAVEPEKARLVALRFFGGLTQRQAADVLGLSPTTADRHWAYARAWLFDALRAAEEEADAD